MTTLLIETLYDQLEQEFTLSNEERYSIGCISPYLYMHNAPAGTFTLSIISGATTVFSQSFTSNDIKTATYLTDDYAHVFFPIVPVNPLQLDAGTYKIRLSASGYTATGSFMGWIRQHEYLNNIITYTPEADDHNPLAFRIKVYKRGTS